jgi:hypothetical protein
MQLRPRSLTVNLAIAFLTLTLVVLLMATLLESYTSIRALRVGISNQQRLTAQEGAYKANVFFQKNADLLTTAVKITKLHAVDSDTQKLILTKLLAQEPSFRQLVLFDRMSQELLRVSCFSSFRVDQIRRQMNNGLQPSNRESKFNITPLYIDSESNEPLVVLSVPVVDIFGDYQGILAAELSLKYLWNLVARIESGLTGGVYIVNKKGDLIAFKDTSRVLKNENLAHVSEVAEFVQAGPSSHQARAEISHGIDDTLVIASHAHLGYPDWAVVVEMPLVEAYRSVIYISYGRS